jgi:hypothetical protein
MATQTTAIISTEDAVRIVEPVVSPVVAQAQALTVNSADDFEYAGEFLLMLANKKKQVESVFEPICKAAHAAWKAATGQRDKFLSPLMTAELAVKGKVSIYLAEEERKRREQERIEADALRVQREAEAAAQAELLASQGEPELAQMVIEEEKAAPAPVVILQSSTPKVTGISSRSTWKWRYEKSPEDTLRLLVKAAAADDRYLAFLMVNESVLTATAKSQKNLMKAPGVQPYEDKGIAVRA